MQTRISILPAIKRALSSKPGIIKLFAIAALLSMAVALFISVRKESFYFEVKLRSSQAGTAQLYYNLGRGMNERDSAQVPVRAGDSMTTVRFPLPAGEYGAFRFDPIDRGYCNIAIGHAQIVDRSGNILWDFSPKDFIATHNISRIRTTTVELNFDLAASERDPYFTINLPALLALRPSMMSFWQFTIRVFFVCFLLFSVVEICWAFFAPLHWTANALLFSLLVAFIFLCARTRFFAPINFDEEIFIWSGWLVNSGSVPYRDLFQPKPPVIFFANALGLTLFGLKDLLFRIVPTTVAVASILLFLVALIKRRVAPWLSMLLTAQVALWLLGGDFHDTGLNDSETYGFSFVLLGFSVGAITHSVRARTGRITLQIVSGICFGLSVLSKELFIFSVIPAWLLAARRGEETGWNWRQLSFSAMGGVAIGISFLGYLITHAALERYLAVLRYARTFAADYCVGIGAFPKTSGWPAVVLSCKKLHEQLFDFNHLAFICSLCAAFLFLLPRSRQLTARLSELAIAVPAIILGMVAVSIGHCFWKHYFLMGTTGLVLAGIIGAEAVSRYLSGKGRYISLGAFIAFSALFFLVAKTPTQAMFTPQGIPQIVSWDPIVTETIERRSKPGEYILATEGPLIYVVMNRKHPIPVGGFTDEILPYMATENSMLRMDSLRDELETHLPKVCYFAGQLRPRQKMWHELLYDPLLAKHHYVQVTDRLWYLPDER